MDSPESTHPWPMAAVFLAAVLAATMFLTPIPLSQRGSARPTDALRAQQAEYRAQLDRLTSFADALHETGEARQAEVMAAAVSLLKEEVHCHAARMEEILYPAVDRRAGTGASFTASLRHGHRLLEAWTAQLEGFAFQDLPDPNAFRRRLERLLGLLEAHLDTEEKVLLPILDRTMTPAQFEYEVGSRLVAQ